MLDFQRNLKIPNANFTQTKTADVDTNYLTGILDGVKSKGKFI